MNKKKGRKRKRTNRSDGLETVRNENQRSKNRERKQREDENPLASTKKLHQRRLPTVDPVAKRLRKTIKKKEIKKKKKKIQTG